MNQKTLARIGAAGCSFFSLCNSIQAQSTAFTYQGRLNDGVNPANGNYELRFYLRDALTAGNPVGPTNTLAPVAVSNGLFGVTLDFGNVFTGTNYWLEVGVRTNGSAASFTVLSPRQALTPSPSALFASLSGNVVDSTITAAKIASGQVVKSLNGLRDDLTLAAGTNVTLTPSGNTLTIASAGVGGAGIWSLNGNNAFYAAGNVGIGASTPHHRLSLIGGPGWTANAWTGSLELPNASAIGWQANAAGQRFGMGHNTGGFFLFRTLSDPGTTGNPALYDFTVDDTGRVGIGTLTPGSKLEIAAQDGLKITGFQPFMTFRDSNAGNARGRIQGANGDVNLFAESYLSGTNPLAFLKLANNGNVGVGTATPLSALDVNGNINYGQLTKLDVANNDTATVRASQFLFGPAARRALVESALVATRDTLGLNLMSDWAYTAIGGNTIAAQGYLLLEANRTYVHGFDGANNHFFSYGSDSDIIFGIHRNGVASYDLNLNGDLAAKTLTINGGADVAEPFQMSSGELPKGAVVVIDEENPGRLKLSETAYDQRVAGIVSGANGISPGLSLRQEGMVEGGQNVALSGRVYVLADALSGAIKPGDLLTSSDTPGYAMRVADHAKAQGAILGKAMSSLKAGKGMVLVLVTLQ